MKNKLLVLLTSLSLAGGAAQAQNTDSLAAADPEALRFSPAQYPAYYGPNLGLTFDSRTDLGTLLVWAPTATALKMRLYEQGLGGQPKLEKAMTLATHGVWYLQLPKGTTGFYTVQATIGKQLMAEVCDPYAHAVGANGRRAAWLEAAEAVPPGWTADVRPRLPQPTDAIIGEASVRDLTIAPTSGVKAKGTFAGLSELGTYGPGHESTGLLHLLELGITHLHLLPINDFAALDETLPYNPARYSWGYDPLNYLVPEGTYATDAQDPTARIRELRQLVLTLHQHGVGLVADVVFNHVADARTSAFEQLVPGYYFRHRPDGSLSNATACGNELASERPMVRRFIVDAVRYWARAYRVDGFRFDLMGVLDVETMRSVRRALDDEDHRILVYGEGWAAGPSTLAETDRAVKANLGRLSRVAAFGDELRDGVKGHYARRTEGGFAGGQPGLEESVKFGIVGAVQHPQLDYKKVNYSKAPWADQPAQVLNYVACHDDQVLWDKLKASHPTLPDDELIKLDILANTIVFTSQGIPFLPIGDEFLRTKRGSSNSYNLPDSVNQLDWNLKLKHRGVVLFYRQLIGLRKAHPAFRLPTQEQVAQHLVFLENTPPGTIAYQLRDHAGGDSWQTITVVFNGLLEPATVPVPAGDYRVALRGFAMDAKAQKPLAVAAEGLPVPAATAVVLVQ